MTLSARLRAYFMAAESTVDVRNQEALDLILQAEKLEAVAEAANRFINEEVTIARLKKALFAFRSQAEKKEG
jgi:hypothetical protein